MAERWTSEMLDQLAGLVRENTIAIAANSEAIAANSEAITELREGVTESKERVTDLRALSADLRKEQAMLAQMIVEERQARQEFRQVTNAALDRIDRTLEELRRDRN